MEIKKEIKMTGESLPAFVPYNKSDKKNKIIASQKTLKYTIPQIANMVEAQNGKKSTDKRSMKK